MNHIIMTGRLTKDPELRYSQSNVAVCRYTLAVDRRIKRDGEPDVDFIDCVAFKNGAEFAGKYLHKGMKILVTGTLQIDSYTDKDGNKRKATKVIINQHEFCESKGQETGSRIEANDEEVRPGQYVPRDGFKPVSQEAIQEEFESNEDLPF